MEEYDRYKGVNNDILIHVVETVSGIHDCKSGRQKQHRGLHFIFPGDDE